MVDTLAAAGATGQRRLQDQHVGERASDRVWIESPPEPVWDVIRDLGAYPQWAHQVRAVEVLEHDEEGRPVVARFTVDARVVEVNYRLRYQHFPQRTTWTLEEGDVVTELDGTYEVVSRDGGCDVTYTLEVDVSIPVPGFLKKRAARAILETSLQGLKQRVEARTGA